MVIIFQKCPVFDQVDKRRHFQNILCCYMTGKARTKAIAYQDKISMLYNLKCQNIPIGESSSIVKLFFE
jgi:hypothetical protein